MRVQIGGEILALGRFAGVLAGKQVVVQARLGIDGMSGRDPVDGGFHSAAVGRVASAGGGIVGAVDLHDFARLFVFNDAGAEMK